MKQIAIITPVPDSIDTFIQNSILRKGVERDLVQFIVVNLRDFGIGNYRQVDDKPFGGGSGMVMMAEPMFKAIDHTLEDFDGKNETRVIYPSPQGEQWTHQSAVENTNAENLIFICGHYKGIDERIVEKYVTHEYSLGDYVVTSGELPALIMIDSIVRLMPGVLNTYESAMTDSFAGDFLDTPCYTRPKTIDGMKAPDVLFGGHHKKIEEWRKKQKEIRTHERRPDLLEKMNKI